LLTMRLINREVKSKIAITEQDLRQYYEDHQQEFAGEKKYHLRTILIRVSSWQDVEEKEKALRRMGLALEALKAGTPFDEVARQYSEDVTARDGGDLGLFKINELAPEVQETVRWMKDGDVSPVLETSQGYQVLMLDEVRSLPGKTLDQARIEIQERLYRDRVEKKYRAWLDTLRKRSYIKIVR
ncbi:MAG: peptidylprolyl isomerase, partial [Deltaproteobacteria bacterium]|nr:peptidylprolyl isomerase [Deltaproteobacteria bacterium]